MIYSAENNLPPPFEGDKIANPDQYEEHENVQRSAHVVVVFIIV